MYRKIVLFIIVLVLSFLHNTLSAADAPILRLETEMHTAPISRIDVDEKQRFLVTGSLDKTVRLWSLPEGNLIRVLRPPLGEGDEGKINAVAISPDGSTIAAGGWTSKTGYDKSIYLFDRATGELRSRLTGHPNVIIHLSYSLDGRYLVASLGAGGIRVYGTSNYSLVFKDTDYGSDSYWAEFDKTGRLVTSCYDGYVRLYDESFAVLEKRRVSGGNQPFAVRFSPNGDKIAVGFADSTQVTVLSGKDLSELYSPDTSGVNNDDISSVAWSADGQKLYAGGVYHDGSNFPIFRWSQSGKGQRHSLPASSSTIMDIKALKNGDIIFGAGVPDFGRFSENGEKTLYKEANIADFRGVFMGDFSLSHNANIVQFGFELWGKRPARFSLDERVLTENPFEKGGISLTSPLTDSLTIADWEDTLSPTLNGKPLALKQYETSRSLAIAPDGQHFLLGADWSLRFYDKNGNEQWKKPVPSTAWGVNIAGNGKVAVAAFGDGTIRWYRLTDGEELLAFFPHKDGKRWIVWTPQGYYVASAGGDDLIGWHLNRGADKAADFFSAAQFRERYYRPDVIAEVLNTRDVEQALEIANKNAEKIQAEIAIQHLLPPIVTILSPAEGDSFSSTDIELRYTVRNPSNEPITALKILIDGLPQKQRGPEKTLVDDDIYSLRIPVPQRDVDIGLIAENRYAASTPATVRLRYIGKIQEFVIKSTLYVLAVGISDYEDNDLDLSYAAKDAQDFAQLLESQKDKGLYKAVEVKLLTNATKDDILDGLEWIEKQVTQHDVAMVFFAGHGKNSVKGEYLFMPSDFKESQQKRTALPRHELESTLTNLAGKKLLFLDTCHSGNISGTRSGVGDIDQIANDLASAENGVVVFAASTGKQSSLERDEWENGAFTKAVIEGLAQQADYTGDGAISIDELSLYIAERVKKLTDGKQTPTTSKPKTVQNFPIAVTK